MTSSDILLYPQAPDDDDYSDPKRAISAFSGAVGSMEGLEFSPAEFWKHQGRTGTHGKRLYQASLNAHRLLTAILAEFEKEAGYDR